MESPEGKKLDPAQILAASRLVIVAGKGGVGKTTVSAAWAAAAATTRLETLLVEVEGKAGLPTLFGQRVGLSYDEVVLRAASASSAEVRARHLTPDTALIEYLEDHGLKRFSKRLSNSGALEVVSTAAPGIKDILVLGKVKQLERAEAADLMVLDAPAAGHAVTFLNNPRSLLEAVRVGPIHTQAREVQEMLTDPARSQVVLVTLPEETPVNELIDTAYQLEDRVGVNLGPVIVNAVYPRVEDLEIDPAEAAEAAGVTLRPTERAELTAAAAFRRRRRELQDEQIQRLAERLPLPQLHLPAVFTGTVGPTELETLSTHLLEAVTSLGAVT